MMEIEAKCDRRQAITLATKGNNGHFVALVHGEPAMIHASGCMPITTASGINDFRVTANWLSDEAQEIAKKLGDAEADVETQGLIDSLDWPSWSEQVDERMCPHCEEYVVPDSDGRCSKCGGTIA